MEEEKKGIVTREIDKFRETMKIREAEKEEQDKKRKGSKSPSRRKSKSRERDSESRSRYHVARHFFTTNPKINFCQVSPTFINCSH